MAGWDVTYQITRRDGKIRMLREVAITLDDASSDHAVVGTLTDITESQSIQNQLRFFENALHVFVDNDVSPMALLDSSLNFVSVGKYFAQLLSYLPEDLNGQSIDILAKNFSILDPIHSTKTLPFSEAFRNAVKQAIESKQPFLNLALRTLEPDSESKSLSIDILTMGQTSEVTGIVLKLNLQVVSG